MSLQKLTTSLFTGTQETSIALASLNFDFSLFKVEAPVEFKKFGEELTLPRRIAAENGTPHVTARKLGALFQRLLPQTPKLIKAYGLRVSEIASSRAINPKASKADGIFANQIGVDGTSIWAAATSGPESIAVHLLACMLARVWSGSEATSIWVELVSERKKELAVADESEPGHASSVAAAQISLPRSHLSEWDASARAWLRAADEGMGLRQKQLMLVLNNVNLPVNTKMNLYRSVIQAWVSAMNAADKLIQGIPQSVQDGAVLLGISSWHIYPDMVVLGNASTEVKQTDRLVESGGILTIGLEFPPKEHENGVYWSLPLAHLRYYGGPVLSARSIATDGNRISIEQLLAVSVGSLTKNWKLGPFETAELLASLWECVSPQATMSSKSGFSHWLALLAYAVEPLFGSDQVAQKLCQQLMRFGERRSPNFWFPESDDVLPLFGLLSLDVLIGIFRSEESGIRILRDMVNQTLRSKTHIFLIRYVHMAGDRSQYEYATAVPIHRSSHKRSGEGSLLSSFGHMRWATSLEPKNNNYRYNPERIASIKSLGEDCLDVNILDIERISKLSFRWKKCPKIFFDQMDERLAAAHLDLIDTHDLPSTLYTAHERLAFGIDDDQPFVCGGDPIFNDFIENADQPSTSTRSAGDVIFDYVVGDVDKLALFVARGSPIEEIQSTVSAGWVKEALRQDAFDHGRLLTHLDKFISNKISNSLLTSLRAMVTLTEIYKMLPNATVALSVTSQPLYQMPWIPKTASTRAEGPKYINIQPQFFGFSLDWASTFACIALFESGSFAIHPESLTSVLAMSVGDSMYIAAPLLCDPCQDTQSHEIRRIRGNVGRPGIAMLIPPQNPRIREFDLSAWQLVNHTNFDGHLENSFQTTSLHLSFTDYSLPLDVGIHGGRDSEVYFLESLVSVHDRGQWVADMDILRMRKKSHFRRVIGNNCSLNADCGKTVEAVIGNPELTMVDNWMEFLDEPNNTTIIRSHGNWIGRLAATTLSLQKGNPTFVLQNKFCWPCIRSAWGDMWTDLHKPTLKINPDVGEDRKTDGDETDGEEKDGDETNDDKILPFKPLGFADPALPQMLHEFSRIGTESENPVEKAPMSDKDLLGLMSEARVVIVC